MGQVSDVSIWVVHKNGRATRQAMKKLIKARGNQRSPCVLSRVDLLSLLRNPIISSSSSSSILNDRFPLLFSNINSFMVVFRSSFVPATFFISLWLIEEKEEEEENKRKGKNLVGILNRVESSRGFIES